MSPRHRCQGFGLFEFLVLSLVTAVVVGVAIGLATRVDKDGGDADRVSLGLSTDSEVPSSATRESLRPFGTAHRRPSASNDAVSPHSVGGFVWSPAAEDVA